MIRMRANLVVRVLDGFTGRPLAPSAICWTMDGQSYRPIAKENGYYVLLNLSPGEHTLILQAGYYLEEKLTVQGGGEYRELLVMLKPGIRYPFGRAVTWLTLHVQQEKQPIPGKRVWVAARNPLVELRIAQESIPAGETTGRLFFPESARTLALPREFLLIDGENTEICCLEELEEPRFAMPLQAEHKRSCRLYPVQCYTSDAAGIIRAVFREPMPLEILIEGKKETIPLELSAGNNEVEITL